MKHIRNIVKKQRDGYEIEGWEMKDFIRGITSGEVSDSSIAAYLMGVYLRGMTGKELCSYTASISESGLRIDWEGLDKPVVDKYSTGGVGDLVSLVLVPLLASCGVYFPLYSGRGLGYAGGTLDKLDSIPGYISQPDLDQFQKVVREVGCAIAGQSLELVPADRRIYRIADEVTCGQAEDIIVASMVAKKLACGASNLVFDIKTGNGAFSSSYSGAQAMSKKIVKLAKACGVKATAFITDMNQPLSYTMGNALEIKETIDYLKDGRRNPRLHEIVMDLGQELLMISGVVSDQKAAEALMLEAITNGSALEKFGKMVSALGGPEDFIEKFEDHLPLAAVIKPVYPEESGKIHSIDTKEFGRVMITLGGARMSFDETLDYSVGVSDIAAIATEVNNEVPIAVVHAKTEEDFELAKAQILSCVEIANGSINECQAVLEKIDRKNAK